MTKLSPSLLFVSKYVPGVKHRLGKKNTCILHAYLSRSFGYVIIAAIRCQIIDTSEMQFTDFVSSTAYLIRTASRYVVPHRDP